MRARGLLLIITLLALICLDHKAQATLTYTVQGQQVFATGINVLGLNTAHFVYQMTLDSAASPYYTSNVGGDVIADYNVLSATLTLTGSDVDGTYTATSPGTFQLINNKTGDDSVVLQSSAFTLAAGKTISATFEPDIKSGVIPNGSSALPIFSASDINPAGQPPIAETFVAKDGTTTGLYQLATGASASVPEPSVCLGAALCAMCLGLGRRTRCS
jgi:hypothetical protein